MKPNGLTKRDVRAVSSTIPFLGASVIFRVVQTGEGPRAASRTYTLIPYIKLRLFDVNA